MSYQDWPIEPLWSAHNAGIRTRQLQARINTHIRQLDELTAQLSAAETFGPDVYTDGAVITFIKQFQEDGVAYHYAMIKARGLWYSTGPKAPKAYAWEDMVVWLTSGPVPTTELWYATDFERVGE